VKQARGQDFLVEWEGKLSLWHSPAEIQLKHS